MKRFGGPGLSFAPLLLLIDGAVTLVTCVLVPPLGIGLAFGNVAAALTVRGRTRRALLTVAVIATLLLVTLGTTLLAGGSLTGVRSPQQLK